MVIEVDGPRLLMSYFLLEQFDEMRRSPRTYYITVIVDTKLDKIVGSGTLVREKKFIHQCGAVRALTDTLIADFEFPATRCFKISRHSCQ